MSGGSDPLTTLGSYRIERQLGRGGMGAVYLAYNTTLHRNVALKVLDGQTANEKTRDLLLREARNAAALNHPNICTVYEVGEANGRAFIAMEYVSGRSLRDRIDTGALPPGEALRLAIQTADALGYAHDHGVVHRDLKAANVIVGDDGRLRVVDFGLARRDDARVAEETTMPSLVAPGTVAGTPYAMAPEQVRGEIADARSDVWAVGVLLHEMTSGAKPFAGASVPELYSSILTAPPLPLPSSVPVGVRAVIERCLQKEPGRRYQNGGEVKAALEAVAAGTTPPLATWRYRVRRRPILGASVAVAGTVIALVAFNAAGLRDRLTNGIANSAHIKLAVLPLQNLTGDPEQEYFSDGVTDELITQLGRLEPARLSVIARTSSMQYKSRSTPIDQIGRELGVDYVLEGSARREGKRIRISATLVRASDQTQQWSDSFDRELAGILSLQHDVARGVASALALKLLPAQVTELAQSRPVNPEAYEAYLKGQSHVRRMTRGDLDRALEYFELALEKDPAYPLTYFGIAGVWLGRRQLGFVGPEGLAASRAAMAKALALEPSLPQRHLALANGYTWDEWNWAAAEPEYLKAIEVLPNDAEARVFFARYLNIMQRRDEANDQFTRALELDPLSEFVRAMYGGSLIAARRYDEAIQNAESILKTTPESLQALSQLSGAYHMLGRYDDAMAIERRTLVARGDKVALEALNRGYAQGGYRGAMRSLADNNAARPFGRTRVAGLYMRAGEHDRALDILETLFDAHENGVIEIGVSRIYDPVRNTPRFQALLRRLNLPS